jgi:hypothetical protein
LSCENPRHREHVKNFIKKYPSAMGMVPDTIILVDPRTWYILDIQEDNTVPCCKVCSISEDIIHAGHRKNEPDRYCSCQSDQV